MEKLKEVIQLQIKVVPGHNDPIVINFKEMLAKGAAAEAVRKKQEEEAKKFEGFKSHFEAGRAQLDQATAARDQLKKAVEAERAPLTEKVTQSSQAAITEFEAARAIATEHDTNLHVVLYSLGEAYDMTGRYDQAIDAYTKAIALKDVPGYYQALGTAQARAGKVTEAMATCDQAAKLNTTAAASETAQSTAECYGNIGILLQNASKMKESIAPFKKATELNPAFAEYWFLLARGLTSAMEAKTEGDKMIAIVQPGTVEAYQKYLELAPDGRFAQRAKDGLEMLKALGVGIDTKVTFKKSKKP
jgi:tetratricopeptide (TPR) repeat protein